MWDFLICGILVVGESMAKKIDDGYKRNTILYRMIRPLLLVVAKIIFNPKIIGRENIPKSEGCVIACNHVHAIDPAILIYSSRRIIHFIAKKELFEGKMRWFYLSFGTIPVDRDKKNPMAMKVAEEFLENDEVIGIFPEGTRNKERGTLLPFKFGAVKMASVTGKKIIPCAITGEYKVFRSTLRVRYGEAIDISGMELEEANNLLREKILLLMEEE